MSSTWGPPDLVTGPACADDDHSICRGHWDRYDGHAVECVCNCHEEEE